MPNNDAAGSIQHVFVLMLENRSFDHMLGFSDLTGTDAESGEATKIIGLTGTESNSAAGIPYTVAKPADFVMPIDPHHEFTDVVVQLCGNGAIFTPGAPYPALQGSGFVENYIFAGGAAPGEILKCYAPSQLPVLTTLAREFAVCDNWFSSMPGPTWPNRFFVHAASSGGLDHSPSGGEIFLWETFAGFNFDKGTIFNSLDRANKSWRIYSGGSFPNVAALRGINNFEIKDMDDFAADVGTADYGPLYTFIEPNYGDVAHGTFRGGNSQHPMDDVTHGEALIKSVYESIRRSPLWSKSLLIVTWDEHGGFYDHVLPPPAVPPGDRTVTGEANQFGFRFDRYGVRVPAVVISPLIPRNVIDHRLYDHASVPATLETLFGLSPLTARDTHANNLTLLASLSVARTDAPLTLPDPALPPPAAKMAMLAPAGATDNEPIDGGNLPGFLHAALRSDLALSCPADHAAILDRFKTIQTRGDAQRDFDEVRTKVRAGRSAIKAKTDRSVL